MDNTKYIGIDVHKETISPRFKLILRDCRYSIRKQREPESGSSS